MQYNAMPQEANHIEMAMKHFWARNARSEATILYLRDIAQVQLFLQNLLRWRLGRVKITKKTTSLFLKPEYKWNT